MKAKRWKVYRCAVERLDGQRRWDEVYQFLLQCMAENCEKSLDERTLEKEQEEPNGSGTLCSCINYRATTGSDN